MLVRLKELQDSGRCDGPVWGPQIVKHQDLTSDQLRELLQRLTQGLVLDLSPRTWSGLIETLVDLLQTSDLIRPEDRDPVIKVLLLPHCDGDSGEKQDSGLDQDSEVALVLSAQVRSLRDPVVALVRLQEPLMFHTVLSAPVRVLFISLEPGTTETGTTQTKTMQTGPAFASVMRDQTLSEALSRAPDPDDVLKVLVQRLEPNVIRRREPDLSLAPTPSSPSPLNRTGALFGGLVRDLRHRFPQYGSDITDALNSQCVAAVIFIYFAALSPAVTFGGLLGEKTDGLMGVSELIIATSLQGLVFALLSAQPMLIIGFSGPLLVFEEAFYAFCQSLGVEYLTARLWVGLWLVVIVVVTVALEGSVLVRHVSRFTQEIFSVLISLIFIYETFVKLVKIFLQFPLTSCSRGNATETLDWRNSSEPSGWLNGTQHSDWLNSSSSSSAAVHSGTRPNTALLSLLLMSGTYLSAFYLRKLKNSGVLPGQLRRTIGDFGVPISIFIMVMVDFSITDTFTQKLSVPSGLSVSTPEKRSWLVPFLGASGGFPVWMAAASALPALLVFILLFMESQITALIVSKRIVKGTGFHSDLLVIVVVGGVSALFGLPWLSAATVRSVTHANALTITYKPHTEEEKPHPLEQKPQPLEEKPHPHEKPRPLEPHPHPPGPLPLLREQRVTAFVVALLVGLSVFVAGLLRQIPVAVLFGVFLYMGVMSLQGIQLSERLQLLIVPRKYHPKSGYIAQMRPWRLHLYTGLQLACLVFLWAVMASPLALLFPFVLLLTVPLRKLLLPLVFTQKELQLLDGEEPEEPEDEYEVQMPV
ncbi:unnamed protein product [Knipowitschia caucasica]